MAAIFPKDFLWGAGTASHQVEGNTHNQWSVWERKNAKRLAKNGGDNLSNMFPESGKEHILATNPQNYISGNGVDHYNLYPLDFDLLQQLKMNAFRFSVEWSRIEPHEGVWNINAINHYKRYIEELKARNIEPLLTVWHWTMPLWFCDKGAFEKKANVEYFVRFATKLASELDVTYIIVLNEPNSYASLSYQQGMWPPQTKSTITALKVYYHLSLAHKRSYVAIKKVKPNSKIGIAANIVDAHASSPHNPFNRLLIWFGGYITNWWFLNRTRKQLDFIGLNYYFTTYHNWRLKMLNPKKPLNDMGWYMEPGSIYKVLLQLNKRYHKPIIITENGLADEQDEYRQWWIDETIKAMRKAIKQGVDLRGYLHWSLIDNFEWAYGWWPKFGLVAVDRKTMIRTIRPSAKWLAGQIDKLS